MSDHAHLIQATRQYLELLKSRGERYIHLSSETVTLLSAPQSRPAPVEAPVSPARMQSAAPRVAPIPYQPPAARTPQYPAVTSVPTPPVAPPPSIPVAKTAVAPIAGGTKAMAMESLKSRIMGCMKCPNLLATRHNVVFGVGNIDTRLMFVGEAPGADEDMKGEPFVGAAGQLLTKIIETMGFSRQQVYIANILKCRPDMPPGSSGNRPPTAHEMATCIPYLLEQVDLIKPEVIVALGATALTGLMKTQTSISRMRGHWLNFRGIPLMPTYHPSYLLRNQALTEKRKVWEDMLAVMEKLNMPISEKQRSFFLKSTQR